MSTGFLSIISVKSTQKQTLLGWWIGSAVKLLATNINNLSSIPRIHVIEGKGQILKATSDLHLFTEVCAHANTK